MLAMMLDVLALIKAQEGLTTHGDAGECNLL